MKKKLVLFDFDGTIADNSEGIYNCIRYALEKKGLPPLSEDILRKFVGPSLFDSFMWHCTKDEDTANELVALYRERYAPVGTTEVKIYEGMKQLLEKLRSDGIITAVCSSKPHKFICKIAQEQGIYELFDGIFSPGLASHVSDKTGLALEAVKHFGVSSEETVFVGDTRFDVSAAKGAGMECIGVLYGFSEEGELDSADYTVSNAEEIYSVLNGEM